MNEEWKDSVNKKKNKKNKIFETSKPSNIEETYFLSNLLSDGACLPCMKGYCKINEEHGIPFPNEFCNFIKYPLNIKTISELIQKEKLLLNDTKIYIQICSYVNGNNCRNCNEGRLKYIPVDGKYILLCFPSSENKREKVTIGIHTDLKLVLKAKNNYDVSIIPMDIIFDDDDDNYEEENFVNDWPDLVNNDLVKNEIKKSLDFKRLFKKDNENIIDIEKIDIEKIDIEKIDIEKIYIEKKDVQKTNVKKTNYLKTLVLKTDVLKTDDQKTDVLKTDDQKTDVLNTDVQKTDFLKTDINKQLNSDIEYNNYLIEVVSKLEIQYKILNDENIELKYENNKFKDEIKILKTDNRKLKKEISDNKFIHDNKNIYERFSNIIENLNNKVSKQYADIHCSEYILS
jgi:hypothetical protein